MSRYTRIKGLSDIRRLPRLGKIRLGVKKVAKSGKEYPVEVSHFVVPPEVAQVYGDQPKELDVMFPTEDEQMVFPQAYKYYVSQGLRCSGNGETAMRRLENIKEGDRTPLTNGNTSTDPNALVEVACPCPLLESGKCSQAANLMVFLPKVSLGGVYQIDTGSFHNIVRINSAIDLVRSVAGHISLVPLKLIRQPEEIQYEGKKATHYLLQLVLNANLSEVAQMRSNSQLVISRAERLVLPAPVEDGPEPTGEAPVMLASETSKAVAELQEAGLVDKPINATKHQVEAELQGVVRGLLALIDEPGDICKEWMHAIQKTTTIEDLQTLWKKIAKKDTGVYHKLSYADQAQLTLTKNEHKAKLEEGDGPEFPL